MLPSTRSSNRPWPPPSCMQSTSSLRRCPAHHSLASSPRTLMTTLQLGPSSARGPAHWCGPHPSAPSGKACLAVNEQLRERQPYLGAWAPSSFEQGALCALAAMSSHRGQREYGMRAGSAFTWGWKAGVSPGLPRPQESGAVLAGNSEVRRRFPFVEAPEWWKLAVPKEGLRHVRHGCDLVKFMDSILIAVVVDDEWKNSLWWGSNTGTHAVTLEARITWDCHIAGLQHSRWLPCNACAQWWSSGTRLRHRAQRRSPTRHPSRSDASHLPLTWRLRSQYVSNVCRPIQWRKRLAAAPAGPASLACGVPRALPLPPG